MWLAGPRVLTPLPPVHTGRALPSRGQSGQEVPGHAGLGSPTAVEKPGPEPTPGGGEPSWWQGLTSGPCDINLQKKTSHFCLDLDVDWTELMKPVLIRNMFVFDSLQLENGGLPSLVNGSAFPSGSALPGPPKLTLAG